MQHPGFPKKIQNLQVQHPSYVKKRQHTRVQHFSSLEKIQGARVQHTGPLYFSWKVSTRASGENPSQPRPEARPGAGGGGFIFYGQLAQQRPGPKNVLSHYAHHLPVIILSIQ